MRHLLLAAFGVLAVSGAAFAQQPQTRYVPQYPPASPAAAAATPLPPAPGATVIQNASVTAYNPPPVGPVLRGGFTMSAHTGGNCGLGGYCQNGCGSVKSDLAFHFGSCKDFFAPCGPTCSGPGFFRHCPATPMAAPWGTGFTCPRTYDSYANH